MTKDYFNPDGKRVGFARGGVYYRFAKRKEHLMRRYQAYALSKSITDQLVEDGCKEIKILEDEKTVYSISMEDFLKNGIVDSYVPGDLQVFCPLKFWKSKKYEGN
jgi:hypothetical protein